MNTFLTGMSGFAMQDIYSGEDNYSEYLTLKETDPKNA
jgi:hypothetical protein